MQFPPFMFHMCSLCKERLERDSANENMQERIFMKRDFVHLDLFIF